MRFRRNHRVPREFVFIFQWHDDFSWNRHTVVNFLAQDLKCFCQMRGLFKSEPIPHVPIENQFRKVEGVFQIGFFITWAWSHGPVVPTDL